jgi:hypothetical protein
LAGASAAASCVLADALFVVFVAAGALVFVDFFITQLLVQTVDGFGCHLQAAGTTRRDASRPEPASVSA